MALHVRSRELLKTDGEQIVEKPIAGSIFTTGSSPITTTITTTPLHPFGVLRNLLLRNLDSKKAII